MVWGMNGWDRRKKGLGTEVKTEEGNREKEILKARHPGLCMTIVNDEFPAPNLHFPVTNVKGKAENARKEKRNRGEGEKEARVKKCKGKERAGRGEKKRQG